jgi:hypothetical protein
MKRYKKKTSDFDGLAKGHENQNKTDFFKGLNLGFGKASNIDVDLPKPKKRRKKKS